MVTGEPESEGIVTMGKQGVRQVARRRAQEMLDAHQERRIAQERRLRDQAVIVLTAIGERCQIIAALELRAGEAIRAMLADGLTLTDAAEWCDGIGIKEITRLSRLTHDPDGEVPS